jgi:hypothetical protein
MPRTADQAPRWHVVIPFFFGRSTAASRKGGAPLVRKRDYLARTVDALHRRLARCTIRVYVCNEQSMEIAREVCPDVQMLTCKPHELPLASVQAFGRYAQGATDVRDDDLFLFNEDDQIIHADDSVLDDIVSTRQPIIFSPHRWSRLMWLFRIKKRPVCSLLGVRGVLDNYDKNRSRRRTLKLGRCYDIQENALEAASFIAFESGIPLVKPSITLQQPVELFVVDHLSGYDYNRKILFHFMYG